MLNQVKATLGITGNSQDATINGYIEEVKAFLQAGGISESDLTSGLIAIGVKDLWNYETGKSKFSDYFIQRATQLGLKGGATNV